LVARLGALPSRMSTLALISSTVGLMRIHSSVNATAVESSLMICAPP
jgi:hypothetical protein